LGNFVRGLALSVSGFMGMSVCMNYASSASSTYLVPAGLTSVSLGFVGFVVMVSGMNRAIENDSSTHMQSESDPALDLPERRRVGDGKEMGRLDDPTAKF
jgi:hypothetical protein